jgi:hypothetical protein
MKFVARQVNAAEGKTNPMGWACLDAVLELPVKAKDSGFKIVWDIARP